MSLPDDIPSLKLLIISLLERIDVLEKQNAELLEQNAKLREENIALRAENALLRTQLNQNSRNSSQPPSKDKYKLKPALPKQSSGKQGGQSGHKGNTLQMSPSPDIIVDIAAPGHCSCGADLNQAEPRLAASRQVFELPPPKLQITEYRQFERQCPSCKSRHANAFPAHVTAPTQYGTGVWAMCSLLSTSFHLSCQNISRLFEDLYGLPLNPATVLQANARSYEVLEHSEELIKQQVLCSQVVHFDESGIACEGKNQWLHVACTGLFTYLFVHAKRGKEALESHLSVLKDFTSYAVHDCYASYFLFNKVSHSLCCAHLLRELQALVENGSAWAAMMRQLLLDLYHATQQGKESLPRDGLIFYELCYDLICQQGQEQEPPPEKTRGKSRRSKGRNLLERLIKHKDLVLAFAREEKVPFTNNQAERDIRPVKGKLKVAGCLRTSTGAAHYARIQGFVSTARKQKQNVFQQLCNAFSGNTWAMKWEQAK
jgi:transposase